jgi:hypothetical protein
LTTPLDVAKVGLQVRVWSCLQKEASKATFR